MKARVTVTLKTGILDPQGKAIEGALRSLAVPGIDSVRQGKVFDIELADGVDAAGDIEGRLREAARQHDRRELPRRAAARSMKAAVVLFPGSNREGDAVRAAAPRRGHRRAHRVARRARPAGRHRPRAAAGRLLLRRLPALRRDRRPLAGHGRGARARRNAAAWCSASATASRSWSKAGLLPGVLMRNANLRFVCRMQHLRVERADTRLHLPLRRRPGDRGGDRAWRGQLHGRSGYCRAARGRRPRRLPLLRPRRPREGQGQPQRLDERDRRASIRKTCACSA